MILTIGVLIASGILLLQLRGVFYGQTKLSQEEVATSFADDLKNIVNKINLFEGNATFAYHPTIKSYKLTVKNDNVLIYDKISKVTVGFTKTSVNLQDMTFEDSEVIYIKKDEDKIYILKSLEDISREYLTDCDSQCKARPEGFTSGVCREAFTIKGANMPANQLVVESSNWPEAYWSFPETDYAWKKLRDLGVKVIQVGGGTEGNVLHIQANENHPWGRAYDPDWTQNLDKFLAKADSYGIKVVFHTMGSTYGTNLGVVAPMYNYERVNPYSSVENALVVIDKLGGNNALKKNFFVDPRVAWWSPINEARLDYQDVRDWTIAVLQRIRMYGGKTSVCVNDGQHAYYETFPYIIPIIGQYVDYLQAHVYLEKVLVASSNNPGYDMYTNAYNGFSKAFQSMVNGKGSFSLDKIMVTEIGCGSGTWTSHMGTQITTVHQQAEYIRAAFDAAKEYGISKIIYHEPFCGLNNRGFGFVNVDGTIVQEPYNVFKSGESSTESVTCQSGETSIGQDGCSVGYTCCCAVIQICSADGTPYSQCSSTKPKYCDDNGNLRDNYCYGPDLTVGTIDDCGCPSGFTCQADGSCKMAAQKMMVGVDYWSGNTVSTFNRDLPLLKDAGIQMLRIEFSRDSVANLRELVPTVDSNGIQVLGLLMRTDLTDDIDAWGNWIYDTVNEFKPYVHVWEIWNEPNLDKFFSGKDPVKYTSFLKRGYNEAKRADSTCFVLGGSVVFTHQTALNFLTAIYQNGGKDYMDALSYHPYCTPYAPDDTSSPNPFVKLTDVRTVMANYGDTRPIWITEVGWTTNDNDEVGETKQADYLVKALEMARNWGWVETFIIYNWKDSSTTGTLTKGLLRTDRTPKPSFYAVKDFISGVIK